MLTQGQRNFDGCSAPPADQTIFRRTIPVGRRRDFRIFGFERVALGTARLAIASAGGMRDEGRRLEDRLNSQVYRGISWGLPPDLMFGTQPNFAGPLIEGRFVVGLSAENRFIRQDMLEVLTQQLVPNPQSRSKAPTLLARRYATANEKGRRRKGRQESSKRIG